MGFDEERLNEYRNSLDAGIARHGWVTQSAPQDNASGTPCFSYTIGLASKGLPELLIFGIPDRDSGDILKNIVDRMINKTLDPKPGTVVQTAAKFPVRLRAIERDAGDSFTLFAMDFADRNNAELNVLQVTYPDKNNVFPGEPGCDAQITFIQDILAMANRRPETHPNGDEYRTHF